MCNKDWAQTVACADGGTTFLLEPNPQGDMSEANAIMESAQYRDSSASCLLKFEYYYNSAEINADPLLPKLKHVGLEMYTTLDFLEPKGNETWQAKTLQIGRQMDPFEARSTIG